MWVEHMERLASFHCLAPDLPGFGRSNGIPWMSRTDAADGVARLIEARVPLGRAHIVGLSVGGSVAHALLARHPDVVDRVLIDGAGVLPGWRDRSLVIGIAAMAPFLHTAAVIGMLSRSVGEIPEPDRQAIRAASRRAFLMSYAGSLMARPSRAEIEARAPTLLVAGEKETSVRRSNAAHATLMPNGIARYVPGLGHGWLGRRMDLHLDMVERWLTDGALPAGLVAEASWPGATAELIRSTR